MYNDGYPVRASGGGGDSTTMLLVVVGACGCLLVSAVAGTWWIARKTAPTPLPVTPPPLPWQIHDPTQPDTSEPMPYTEEPDPEIPMECPAGYEEVMATCNGSNSPDFACWHPELNKFRAKERKSSMPIIGLASLDDFTCVGAQCKDSAVYCGNGQSKNCQKA